MSYLNLTLEDYINAGIYASQEVKKYRYNRQKSEKRWNLPSYNISERPFNDEFYLPTVLQKDFKFYTFSFPEESCAEMSCYFNLNHDKLCPKKKAADTIYGIQDNTNNKIYKACQNACYRNAFTNIPFVCETYYEDNKCLMRSTAFKHYCLFPKSRNEVVRWGHPPSFIYNEDTGDCSITEKYCKFFGIDYNSAKKDCEISDAQSFFEDHVFGRTVFRAFKFAGRLEDTRSIDSLIHGLLYDAGVESSLIVLKHLSLKGLPLLNKNVAQILISQFQGKFGLAVARASAVALVLRTSTQSFAAQAAIKISAAIGSASTVVGYILLYFTVIGLILDTTDPFNLSAQVTADKLGKLKYGFQYMFAKQLKHNTECTPERFILMYSKGLYNEEENIIYMEQLSTYFQHLEYNADGVRNIKRSDTGLTVEQMISKIIEVASRAKSEDDSTVINKMDTLFSKFAVFFSIVIPLFLAVSI